MSYAIKGKNLLITGAAKGIGRGIAIAAATNGANIVIHYLGSKEAAEKTAREISEYNVEVTTVKGDIASLTDVKHMKEELDRGFGKVDMIVNNAGLTQVKPFFKYDPSEWQHELEVCFNGVLNLAYTFIPEMKENNQGKFINIVGDSARTGDRNLIISGAARNGAISFIKSLAQEVGRNNIQCNTLSLGLIDQGRFDFEEDIMTKILKQYPLQRLGSVSDVTGAVLFLLSNASDWITGQVLSVNGGHSMSG